METSSCGALFGRRSFKTCVKLGGTACLILSAWTLVSFSLHQYGPSSTLSNLGERSPLIMSSERQISATENNKHRKTASPSPSLTSQTKNSRTQVIEPTARSLADFGITVADIQANKTTAGPILTQPQNISDMSSMSFVSSINDSVTNSSRNCFGKIVRTFDLHQAMVSQFSDHIPVNLTWFASETKIPSFPVLLHNRSICERPPYLMVLVPSVLQNTETRAAIRQSWATRALNTGWWAGQRVDKEIRVAFVLGGSRYSQEDMYLLRKENDRHGDIIVIDFVDSYRNLTIKVASGLEWVLGYCRRASHVLKVDEDTFVHVPQLLEVIRIAEQISSQFVLGHKHSRYLPTVARAGRWKVSWEYFLPYYPRYLLGHSYVISGQAVKPLLDMYKQVPTLPNEDAFFTGILAKLSNVTRLHHLSFAVPRLVTPCDVARGYFLSATNCCNDHLRYLYQVTEAKVCDISAISSLPFRDCRFVKHMTDDLIEEGRAWRNNCSDFRFDFQ